MATGTWGWYRPLGIALRDSAWRQTNSCFVDILLGREVEALGNTPRGSQTKRGGNKKRETDVSRYKAGIRGVSILSIEAVREET